MASTAPRSREHVSSFIGFGRFARRLDALERGLRLNNRLVESGVARGAQHPALQRLRAVAPAAPADTGFKLGESPVQHAGGPFNMVTNVAVAGNGQGAKGSDSWGAVAADLVLGRSLPLGET